MVYRPTGKPTGRPKNKWKMETPDVFLKICEELYQPDPDLVYLRELEDRLGKVDREKLDGICLIITGYTFKKFIKVAPTML